MQVWESIEVPEKIEFVSYAPEDCEEVLQLIPKAFYRFETVSSSTKICENAEALKELLEFCKSLLEKTKVAIVARDVAKNKIVGFSFNFIQVTTTICCEKRALSVSWSLLIRFELEVGCLT